MDFGNAVLLIAVVMAATAFVKRFLPADIDPKWVQLTAIGIAIGTVFLVGATVWAHEQVIGNHALDDLDVGSKALVGLLIGLGSNFTKTFVVDTVKSVGENQPDA